MKISWTKTFYREYHSLPQYIRDRFDEKIQLFVNNTRHPSLRVKKMSGTESVWETSITINYRWTFEWVNDLIKLRHIGTHSILNKE